MNKLYSLMQDRVRNNLDPLTGEPMRTAGVIRVCRDGLCRDNAGFGRVVTLNRRGTWVYVEA